MDIKNEMLSKNSGSSQKKTVFNRDDEIALGHMRFSQGVGASLRYANELRAVQQVGRLPFLKSSHLHEDVIRGNLGPGSGFKGIFGEPEEERATSRLAYL